MCVCGGGGGGVWAVCGGACSHDEQGVRGSRWFQCVWAGGGGMFRSTRGGQGMFTDHACSPLS